MACTKLLSPISKQGMDGRQSDGGGGGEQEVEDEFACAGMLRGSLLSLHSFVERIFGVSFGVGTGEGAAELPHNNGQIWLQLRGPRSNVTAAKLFVRGVVNQEQQQEVSYPGVLHCVFCGARGLFMDCLIKNTSAHIVVGSPGCLLISGLTEPVVRAYSLITDLVERYEGTQGRRAEIADRSASESLDSRRAFKSLVERREDRHTLDLLVLPGAVKETLLDLARESGLGSSVSPGDSEERAVHGDGESQRIWEDLKQLQLLDGTAGIGGVGGGETREIWDVPSSAAAALLQHSDNTQDPDVRHRHTGPFQNFPQLVPLSASPPASGTERWGDGGTGGLPTDTTEEDPFFRSFATSSNSRGRAEGAEARPVRSPQEVGEEERVEEEEDDEEEGELLLSVGSKKEFGLLLKFFTAMGYMKDVVRRVLARTGPKEASQILDLIQREQDRSGSRGQRNQEDPRRPDRSDRDQEKIQDRIGRHRGEKNLPSETEHREGEEARGTDGSGNVMRGDQRVGVDVQNAVGGAGEGVRDRETDRPRSASERRMAPDFGAEASAVEMEREGEEGGSERVEEGRETGEGGSEDDFVLGVLKRAAASCGYTEEKVAEVCSLLPDLSTHQLLLELQREGARETETGRTDSVRAGPREVDEVASAREGEEERGRGKEGPALPLATAANRVERKREKERTKKDQGGMSEVPDLTAPIVELDLFSWDIKHQPQQPSTSQFTSPTNKHQLPQSHALHQTVLPEIRGPPLSTYPPTYNPQFPSTPIQVPQTNLPTQPTHSPKQPHPQPAYLPNPEPPPTYHPMQPPQDYQPTYPTTIPLPPSSAFSPHPVPHPAFAGGDSSPTRPRDRRGFLTSSSGAVVTGEQRFLEGLQTPFGLQLTDDPGDAGLRMIIIDGSNVAMSHGLGHFFSCRGIALAVQHFWNGGHRRISTFLPQWRQKRDPKIKEQHFLTELQNLGLLSYTPSREVQGKRINSYDDRFMLQLAQKTDGVIVTNDNLRDLLDESHVWRDIIKKRLLQYTFVGDHFMVPDDPLGRGGPHLDDFLRSQHRPPDPGHHSFAGIASPFPSSKPPRSQTELLHFRDRTPGVALDRAEFGGSWGRESGQDRGGGHMLGIVPQQQRRGPDAGTGRGAERSAGETARLRESLCQVFPGQESMVTLVLQSHPAETDINSLSHLILEQQGD